MKFYDLQTGDYSHHIDIKGLFTMITEQYCECTEDYDILDEKDGKMKCLNCWRINNLEKVSEREMISTIKSHGYRIDK